MLLYTIQDTSSDFYITAICYHFLCLEYICSLLIQIILDREQLSVCLSNIESILGELFWETFRSQQVINEKIQKWT